MNHFKNIKFRVINPLKHDVPLSETKTQPNSLMDKLKIHVVNPDEYKRDHVNSVPAGRFQF